MSQEVVERAAQVPDLHRTPALTITAEDVALPRLYIGQFMSKAVQDQLVKAGQIFSATGQDDPDPQVLWDPWRNTGTKAQPKYVWDPAIASPVRFYVLGLRKGKSISDGGELQLFDFDDPNAPADAWVTYNYTVAVPSQDHDVPYKLLLTRTGRPAAQQINTVLKKNSISGPAWESAFVLTTAERENQKGKWYVPRAAVTEAVKAEVEVAHNLAVQMSTVAPEYGATGDVPAI